MKLSLESMSERERRMVSAGGALAAALLVFGVIVPLDRSVAHVHERVGRKQADLVWMRGVAPELAAAGPQSGASGGSLLVIVDRSARESGLGASLAGSEPSGSGALSVRLEKAPFDTLVAWLARLAQQNGIHVDAATIDNAGAPGIVNAAVVLRSG
ncbi:MAG: type II secretion system protein M [Gammaproteobacteria bacterium]|nr:MAG: type II secretion system protein M [Gammaproteobacteria bacterium]